jgi:transposase-like protein
MRSVTHSVRKLQKQVNSKQGDLDRLKNILQSVTEDRILVKKGGKRNAYSESLLPNINDENLDEIDQFVIEHLEGNFPVF